MKTPATVRLLTLLTLVCGSGCGAAPAPDPVSEACRGPASFRVGCREARSHGTASVEEAAAEKSAAGRSRRELERAGAAMAAPVRPTVEPRPPHTPEPPKGGHPPHK